MDVHDTLRSIARAASRPVAVNIRGRRVEDWPALTVWYDPAHERPADTPWLDVWQEAAEPESLIVFPTGLVITPVELNWVWGFETAPLWWPSPLRQTFYQGTAYDADRYLHRLAPFYPDAQQYLCGVSHWRIRGTCVFVPGDGTSEGWSLVQAKSFRLAHVPRPPRSAVLA